MNSNQHASNSQLGGVNVWHFARKFTSTTGKFWYYRKAQSIHEDAWLSSKNLWASFGKKQQNIQERETIIICLDTCNYCQPSTQFYQKKGYRQFNSGTRSISQDEFSPFPIAISHISNENLKIRQTDNISKLLSMFRLTMYLS